MGDDAGNDYQIARSAAINSIGNSDAIAFNELCFLIQHISPLLLMAAHRLLTLG
jgi:hypothetical protein